MKATFWILGAAVTSVLFALPLLAQSAPSVDALPAPQDVVEGHTFFVERIALPPDARLFVSLTGRVTGAEYLPLATGVFPARNSTTSFRLLVPHGMAPAGPYRVQAWIVADNRLWMNGANPRTVIDSLSVQPKIRLKVVPTPLNGDAIGDGQTPMNDSKGTSVVVTGTIVKRDRRALPPGAQIEVTLADVSLADAPSKVMANRTFSPNGKQLPFPFEVPVNVALEPKHRYSLMVRISEEGKLIYISDTLVPVTPDNISTPFEINVVHSGG